MNTDDSLENLFEKIKELSSQPDTNIYGTGLESLCHKLADAHYLPAKELFINKLDDSRWDWRRVSVSLLGFHYELEPDVIEKFRDLLAHDPDSDVRIASASVLGVHGQFPEKVLIDALESDSNKFVREAAFSALLVLAKIPYKTRSSENKKIREGKISVNLDEVKRILLDENRHAELAQF